MSSIKEPRSLESEQRVLGALLLDSTLLSRVRAVNSHECGYQAHLVSFL